MELLKQPLEVCEQYLQSCGHHTLREANGLAVFTANEGYMKLYFSEKGLCRKVETWQVK